MPEKLKIVITDLERISIGIRFSTVALQKLVTYEYVIFEDFTRIWCRILATKRLDGTLLTRAFEQCFHVQHKRKCILPNKNTKINICMRTYWTEHGSRFIVYIPVNGPYELFCIISELLQGFQCLSIITTGAHTLND